MSQKISVELGNGYKLVAECGIDPIYPREMFVYIEDKDGCASQDLAVVRNKYHYEGGKGPVYDDKKLEILVYGDEYTEDYTDLVEVGIYEDGEGEKENG